MTRRLFHTYDKGFSLVDLIISLLIASIVLIGVYKAFLSNIKTATGSMDLAALDNKTRKTVEMIQSDVSSLNGNVLTGLPTIFPTISPSGTFDGFVIFTAEKMLPVLEMEDAALSLPDSGAVTVSVSSSALGENVNENAVTQGMTAVLYNYKNYAWIPLRILGRSEKTSDTFDVEMQKLPSAGSDWVSLLSTPKCTDYMVNSNFDDDTKVCDPSGQYEKSNTVFIIVNSVEYRYDSLNKTLVRILNNDLNNQSILAHGVDNFEPRLVMRPNPVYTDMSGVDSSIVDSSTNRIVIEDQTEIHKFVQNLIPDPSNEANDDCRSFLNYKCLDESGNLNALAYGYTSSMVSGIDINMTMKTESERSKSLKFLISLDENQGNTSLTAFMPTKVVATKDTATTRPFGSIMSTPFFFSDPEGGSIQPFFTAAAPMVSAVYKNDDDAVNDPLMDLCKTNPSFHPTCTADKVNPGDGHFDWETCFGSSNEALRFQAGCLSPQGALNDRGVDPADTRDNSLDPKIVFINGNAQVQSAYTYDLSRYCTGTRCPLNNYYNGNFYGSGIADTPFPMTLAPRFDSEGNLLKLYVGTARLRYPNPYPGILIGANYFPYYHSVVFAIDTFTDPNSPTSMMIREDDIANISKDTNGTYPDIASVSSLSLRDEGSYTYMYLSSHETHELIYRKRPVSSNDDSIGTGTGWTRLNYAFKDTTPNYVKYGWKIPIHGYSDDIVLPYPVKPFADYKNVAPQKEYGTIVTHHAHDDGRIYYCTNQAMPDTEINGPTTTGSNMWFYNHEIRYSNPIIHPSDEERYVCDPTINDPNDERSWYYQHPTLGEVCHFPANTPKPIDWVRCIDDPTPTGSGNCFYDMDQRPVATEIMPDYSARLMVAFKVNDGTWVTKKVANLHGMCTNITSDPYTGDLVVSSPNNVKIFSYEEMNETITDPGEAPYIDLGFRRADGKYTANNVVDDFVDPTSPSKNIELRKISGTNIFPSPNNLKIVFTDTLKREIGFITQARNSREKELFTQIVYNPLSPHDANLDLAAVHTKNRVDIGAKFARWLVPFTSTASWAVSGPLTGDETKYHTPAPIQVRPPQGITDWYKLDPVLNPDWTGSPHTRLLSNNDSTCLKNTKPIYGIFQQCGQSYQWRECAGDVLSQTSMGLSTLQYQAWGCGVGYPVPSSDPGVTPD